MTLTQERQLYGPQTRKELLIDGTLYVVRRDDVQYVNGRYRWRLSHDIGTSAVQDAYCDLPITSEIGEAVSRLTGR